MANDKDWEKRTTEWVNMSHKSKQRKEAEGKSREQTETKLTEQERGKIQKPSDSSHSPAIPPHP